MKVFVFDASLCNGCYGCQLACKDEHCDNEWLPYAVSQPDTGHFWGKIHQTDHGQTPKVKVEYSFELCDHCDDAPCMKAAPDAIYKRDDGLVVIDPEKAKGCKEIVDSCPFGHIYWNENSEVPQKCTGCAHLVDEGELPHCVDMCATGALRFGDEEDFAPEIARAETLIDSAYGPRVYYLNRPHLFIGGEVWDPESNEIIEGAQITLSGDASQQTTSDNFGDFWFRKLDPGKYTVDIAAEGYVGQSVDVDLTESLNIGDFPLERKELH